MAEPRLHRPQSPERPSEPPRDDLSELLRAQNFFFAPGAEKIRSVYERLSQAGQDSRAAWFGAVKPPEGTPSVGLGAYAGTLGPHSYGFLNNHEHIAVLDATLPVLPRRGSLSLLVPRQDALPDIGTVCLSHGWGIAWIISYGSGDPTKALRFLERDRFTDAIGLVLDETVDGQLFHEIVPQKRLIALGGNAFCRAAIRRKGGTTTQDFRDWTSQVSVAQSSISPDSPLYVLVSGAGEALVKREADAIRARLAAPVQSVAGELPTFADGATVIWVESGRNAPVPAALEPLEQSGQLLRADLTQPEALRSLFTAILSRTQVEERPARLRIDRELLERIHQEEKTELNDHDTKRLLKAYGIRVTRQAPATTPTQAVKIARTIGFPVWIVQPATPEAARVANNPSQVKHVAALFLQSDAAQVVMIREWTPAEPMLDVAITYKRDFGQVLTIKSEMTLLPLTRSDAAELARLMQFRRSSDQRAIVDFLLRLSACAYEENSGFQLRVNYDSEPIVIQASGKFFASSKS